MLAMGTPWTKSSREWQKRAKLDHNPEHARGEIYKMVAVAVEVELVPQQVMVVLTEDC